MSLQFEWDLEKSKNNELKHGITFDEAKTIFNDPLSITIFDSSHSRDENRYIDIGLSYKNRIIVVVYAERIKSIRIISSRKATKKEIKEYEENR